mmetsp:Transcript_68554/g.187950  ORF Transcript_68554/g.187950 Transcript_68554/m.187950 type:complete len:245 (-) Transcript_68554:552-1286(-)
MWAGGWGTQMRTQRTRTHATCIKNEGPHIVSLMKQVRASSAALTASESKAHAMPRCAVRPAAHRTRRTRVALWPAGSRGLGTGQRPLQATRPVAVRLCGHCPARAQSTAAALSDRAAERRVAASTLYAGSPHLAGRAPSLPLPTAKQSACRTVARLRRPPFRRHTHTHTQAHARTHSLRPKCAVGPTRAALPGSPARRGRRPPRVAAARTPPAPRVALPPRRAAPLTRRRPRHPARRMRLLPPS